MKRIKELEGLGLSEAEMKVAHETAQSFSTAHNRLAIEMNVPLDVARSMIALASSVVPALAETSRGDRLQALALGSAYVSAYVHLAEPLGVPEERLAAAAKEALRIATNLIVEYSRGMSAAMAGVRP